LTAVVTDWDLGDRKAWDPDWEHVLTFLAGKLDGKRVHRLLELFANEDRDDVLRHRLALAARCLPEISEPARSGNEQLISRICERTVSLCRKQGGAPSDQPAVAGDALQRALGAVASVKEGQPFLDLLADDLSSERDHTIHLIEMMGAVVATQDRIVDGLLDLLRDWKIESHWRSAARALGKLGPAATDRAVQVLLMHLDEYSGNQYRLLEVIRALDELGSAAATEQVVTALTRRIVECENDEHMRTWGRHTPLPEGPGMIEALVRWLGDLLFYNHDGETTRALRRVVAEATVPAKLVNKLEFVMLSEDSNVDNPGGGSEEARQLAEIANAGAIEQVLQARRRTNSEIRVLSMMEPTKPVVLVLLDKLGEPSSLSLYSVLEFVGVGSWPKAGHVKERDRRWLEALRSEGCRQQVVDFLLRAMESDSDAPRVAEALARLGCGAAAKPVVKALVRQLEVGETGLWDAARVLCTLGSTAATAEVADALSRRLGDKDSVVRWMAAQALVRIGTAAVRDGVVEKMGEWISDCDKDRVVSEMAGWLQRDLLEEQLQDAVESLASLGCLSAAKPAVQQWVNHTVPHAWNVDEARVLQAFADQGVRVFAAAPQAAGGLPIVESMKTVEELSA